MSAVIAIDQGTTGSKAYRLEADGRFLEPGRVRSIARSFPNPAGSSMTRESCWIICGD